jgi:hypothetical protein
MARKIASLPPAAAKYKGKLMSINRAKQSITVVDPKLRKKVASIPIPASITYKKGHLYYIKSDGIYEAPMAKRGMKASHAQASDESDSSDFSE